MAGGVASAVVGGNGNKACDANTVIGAGNDDVIGGDGGSYTAAIMSGLSDKLERSAGAFIGGGQNNTVSDLPPYYNSNLSAIAGGISNIIASPDSFIGAGQSNTIVPPSVKLASGDSPSGFIGSGQNNTISSDYSVITGGYNNSVSGEFGTISGGYNNTVSGTQAVVMGGYGNVASGKDSVIVGGASNVASGAQSFAAGTRSHAATVGSFVWSDYSNATGGLTATVPNQFDVRASGGFYFYSSANLRSGVTLAPGSGSWSSLSDRASKTSIVRVNEASILAKVVALPVSEWSYAQQGSQIRHIGPMAQDFRKAFGLGEDDKHISVVDEEGVALAAIKSLEAEVDEKDRKIDEIRRENELEYRRLEHRLQVLEIEVRSR